MPKKLLKLKIIIIMLLISITSQTGNMINAQNETGNNIKINVDTDYIAIHIIGEQPVALEGLTLGSLHSSTSGGGNEIGQYIIVTEFFPLLENIEVLDPGTCLILTKDDIDSPLPSDCEQTLTFQTELPDSEIFWAEGQQKLDIVIFRGDELLQFCTSVNESCLFYYQPPITLAIYDDFGSNELDATRWIPAYSENCSVEPNNSQLLLTNEANEEAQFCNLAFAVGSPAYLSPEISIEAQIGVNDNESTEEANSYEINQGLGLFSNAIEGNWYVFCGLSTNGDSIAGAFTGIGIDEETNSLSSFWNGIVTIPDANGVENPITFNNLYTFRIEYDEADQTLQCYINNILLGVSDLSSPILESLYTEPIERSLNSYRQAGSIGATVIDNVKIAVQ